MVKEPTSMGECIYFTIRTVGSGKIRAWVFKATCPQCKKGLMGKPRDPKTGKPKIRAKEYVCHECKYSEEKKEHEEKLTASIKYTCPHCEKSGETEIPFKRKKVQLFNEEKQKKYSVDALQFLCDHCNEKINITKKMK